MNKAKAYRELQKKQSRLRKIWSETHTSSVSTQDKVKYEQQLDKLMSTAMDHFCRSNVNEVSKPATDICGVCCVTVILMLCNSRLRSMNRKEQRGGGRKGVEGEGEGEGDGRTVGWRKRDDKRGKRIEKWRDRLICREELEIGCVERRRRE